MAVIHFFDRSKTGYTGDDLQTQPVGGIQQATASLAEALARRGHTVTVFGTLNHPARVRGVDWRPLIGIPDHRAEIAIVNDRPGLLRGHPGARMRVVWFHNPVSSVRLARRFNLFPMIRHRPMAVFLGRVQTEEAPGWLPFRRRLQIAHGITEPFLAERRPRPPGPPVALFTAQPYRGLAWLIEVWPQIRATVPNAELHVYVTKPDQLPPALLTSHVPGLRLLEAEPPPVLARRLTQARLLLLPGHRDETFCLAAAEATACGVPTVTRGLGALVERVRDGVTGHVRADAEGFAAAAARILTDDGLWQQMHQACLEDPEIISWDQAARRWVDIFQLEGGKERRG